MSAARLAGEAHQFGAGLQRTRIELGRIFEARRLAEEPITGARRVRRLARARAPDRRMCLREGAEVGEEARRRDGKLRAPAGALASNPLQYQ